ncbi:MAG: chemotaxis protein CheX [Planctomycetota bacterium]
MSTTTAPAPLLGLEIDSVLLRSVVQGVHDGLSMTGLEPPPVGASKLYSSSRPIAVMIGMVGRSNGMLTINMTERGMLHIAGKLSGEEQKSINEENLDAIGEVGNMIAGCVKDCLVGTEYEVTNISVPSVILGANYDFYLTRGFNTVCVEFELPGIPIAYQRDRFFTATVSLLRRVA